MHDPPFEQERRPLPVADREFEELAHSGIAAEHALGSGGAIQQVLRPALPGKVPERFDLRGASC